jgi:serine/threonine-protein kinase HipA
MGRGSRLRSSGPEATGSTIRVLKGLPRCRRGCWHCGPETLLKEPPDSDATTKTYPDIAAVARSIGVAAPETDIVRRLTVNAFLYNTGDHLRDHAVINEDSQWELSPTFDIVPHLGRKQHVCAPAAGVAADPDPASAFSAEPAFGIARDAAEQVLEDTRAAIPLLPDFMDQREMRGAGRALLKPLQQSG